MAASASLSLSKTWRDEGAKLARADDSQRMSPEERIANLKMALQYFSEALSHASDLDERASAAKNAANTSDKLASLHRMVSKSTADDVQVIKDYYRTALINYKKAKEHGCQKDRQWKEGLDDSLKECFKAALEAVSSLESRFRLMCIEDFTQLLPDGLLKAHAFLFMADTLNNLAMDAANEKRYQEALKYLRDCNFPLEESTRLSRGDEDINSQITRLRDEIQVRSCVAEAMQLKDRAEVLLERALREEEFLQMETVWEATDVFRQAIAHLRGQESVLEAHILSRLGFIYSKINRMPERAYNCYWDASQLAQTSTISMEDEEWYKETKRYIEGEKKRQEEDKEDQKWKEEKRKKLAKDLEKLHAHANDKIEDLLKFIYKTWPPKHKNAKLDQTNEKAMLRMALMHYHPDQQKTKYGRKWYVLSEEICKVLTKRNEAFK